jgi:hypothetical protein
MGNSSYSDHAYRIHTHSTYSGKTREEIFKETNIDPSLDPAKFELRECVTSKANPDPTPIILASDVTGSMGELAEEIVRHGLGDIMNALYERRPVSDPQILCMAIGDSTCDRAPVQMTQFEADGVVLAKQVEKIWLEGGGGGNGGESYSMAWAGAAYKTHCDAFPKRKGYLFTIGDECLLDATSSNDLKRFLKLTGINGTAEELLKSAQDDWHVFHLIVKPVSYQPVRATWKHYLGQRAVDVEDHKKLAEGIVAIIQKVEGASDEAIRKGYKGTALAVVESVAAQLTR